MRKKASMLVFYRLPCRKIGLSFVLIFMCHHKTRVLRVEIKGSGVLVGIYLTNFKKV